MHYLRLMKEMRELTDDDMGTPGSKVTKEQLDNWLSKDDGESFELTEAFKVMKDELATKLKNNVIN
jgi:hypothetical protein